MATETTKITYVEGAAASTPAATRVVTYAKADGLMYSKDDAGTETLMSAGATGNVMLADSLLGSDTASFDFTSISGSYKHLEIVLQGRSTNAGTDVDVVTLRFNNDSGANYDDFWMQFFNGFGTGSGNEDVAATSMAHFMLAPGATSTAGAVMGGKIVIPDYASTTLWKVATFSGFDVKAASSSNLRVQISGGIWHSTAAITRVTLAGAGNWKTGSRATLYGLS